MDDAEDGGVGADADRERANHDCGEPRRAHERAHRESCVLPEVVEPAERPRIAMHSFACATPPNARRAARRASPSVNPRRLYLVLEDTEVRGQLAFEFGLSAMRLEEMDETQQESSDSRHRYGSLSRRASTKPARRRQRSVSFASARVPAFVMLSYFASRLFSVLRQLPLIQPFCSSRTSAGYSGALVQREAVFGYLFQASGETVGVLGTHRLQRAQQNEVQGAL